MRYLFLMSFIAFLFAGCASAAPSHFKSTTKVIKKIPVKLEIDSTSFKWANSSVLERSIDAETDSNNKWKFSYSVYHESPIEAHIDSMGIIVLSAKQYTEGKTEDYRLSDLPYYFGNNYSIDYLKAIHMTSVIEYLPILYPESYNKKNWVTGAGFIRYVVPVLDSSEITIITDNIIKNLINKDENVLGILKIQAMNQEIHKDNWNDSVFYTATLLNFGVLNLLGLPGRAYRTEIVLKASIMDSKGELIKSYDIQGIGIAYAAMWWGYAARSRQVASKRIAVTDALNKLFKEINRDYPTIIQRLKQNTN